MSQLRRSIQEVEESRRSKAKYPVFRTNSEIDYRARQFEALKEELRRLESKYEIKE